MGKKKTFSNQVKIDTSLLNLPDPVLFKDLNSDYLGCNDVLAKYVGIASSKDCIGKNDRDFPWFDYSETYQKADRFITRHEKPFYFIEPVQGGNNKIIDCLTIKAPLYNSNSAIAGIQCILISLENSSFNRVLQKFIDGAQRFNLELHPSKVVQIITQIIQCNNCRKQWNSEARLFDYGKVSFSFREAQCLHYFFNHYSAEKTSMEIFISKKTVEFHLAKIKQKLNCFNASQLTNLAIDYGFIDLMFMKF